MNSKPIFDAVRRLLGRGFTAAEVRALDAAIEAGEKPASVTPDAPSAAEATGTPALVSDEGIALIQRFEGCARRLDSGMVEAYPDPGTGGAPWTIGWGSTGPGIGPGVVWTQAQCDRRLERDLVKYAREVIDALGGAPTSQAQFDALVSFHYNTGAIGRATLTRRHRAGDYGGAEREFLRWNRGGGRVLPGLTKRRLAEAALYRRGS